MALLPDRGARALCSSTRDRHLWVAGQAGYRRSRFLGAWLVEVRSEMRNHLATRATNYGVRCSDVLFHLLSEWLRGVFFPVPLCGQARVVVDSLRTFVVVAEISGNSVLSGKRRAVSWAGYAGFDCRKTNCWLVSDLGA